PTCGRRAHSCKIASLPSGGSQFAALPLQDCGTIEDYRMTDILSPAKTLPVKPKRTIWNPSPEALRKYTEEMPNCKRTEFGNVNVGTRVVSRSKLSTFIATDTPENHSDQTITRS